MPDRVRRKPVGAALLLAVFVVVAISGPWWIPHDPVRQFDLVALRNATPSATHWFGTDAYARDVFSRAVIGARTSFEVAVTGTLVALAVAVLIGMSSAWLPARLGQTLMAGVDVLRALPRKLVLLLLLLLVPMPSALALGLLLGVSSWMGLAFLVYEHTRSLRTRPFVESAQAMGTPTWRLAWVHVLPHVRGALAAASAILLADLLALEAAVSFLGIGIRAPRPSWGSMVLDSLPYLESAWWVAAVPCVLLAATVVATGIVADALAERQR
ncbi:MAG: ABC transporter permease [Gemmatimonadaceae bacterium]|nr:ABC transporter permease [Gemmatimonadaceae bacterium]